MDTTLVDTTTHQCMCWEMIVEKQSLAPNRGLRGMIVHPRFIKMLFTSTLK